MCEKCLYKKNCQFLAKHKKSVVENCTAFLSEDEYKAEIIKEFAERLIRNITINNTNDGYLDYAVDYNCLVDDINDLVKEMVGEG